MVRILEPTDAALLISSVGVFDRAVRTDLAAQFLGDPRHHIAAAIVDDRIFGFVSAVHYLHPDKDPELWINEVGVHEDHRGQGVGRVLLDAMLEHGRSIGCVEAWVLTEAENTGAMRLYSSANGQRPDGEIVMYEWQVQRQEPPGSRQAPTS